MLAGSRQMPSVVAADALDERDEVGGRDLLVGLERERDAGCLVGGERGAQPVVGLGESSVASRARAACCARACAPKHAGELRGSVARCSTLDALRAELEA